MSHEKIQGLVDAAFKYAAHYKSKFVNLDHFLLSALDDDDARASIKAANPEITDDDIDEMISNIDDHYCQIPTSHYGEVKQNKGAKDLIQYVVGNGALRGRSDCTGADLILGITYIIDQTPHMISDEVGMKMLSDMGIDLAAMQSALNLDRREKELAEGIGGAAKSITSPDEADKCLRKYCKNLNEMPVGKIDPLIGRSTEIDRLVKILHLKKKSNVMLVGEPGVGKTAVAEGLAMKIVNGDVPSSISTKQIWSLDMGSLIAGTKYRGEMEERVKQIAESLAILPDSIIFIDEIHTMLGAGSGGGSALDVANILKPGLANGTIRCIGATTHDEYTLHVEKDAALARRFKKLTIEETNYDDTVEILMGLKPYYEDFHNVKYSDEAVHAAVSLATRHIVNKHLPDKAIDVMDEVGAEISLSDRSDKVITLADIQAEVARIANIPAKMITEGEREKILTLEDDLKKVVFGQDTAISNLVDATIVARAGLRDHDQPLGCFMFAGPTGVGKTEATKQLAETLGLKLLRFDMSEYQEKHSISRLIGVPPGYVGYDEASGSGKLTSEVEKNPHCVILLDEIEKAHPDIFTLLLQVMDGGRLTNTKGKTIDFSHTVLVMTTNTGAFEMSKKPLGFGSGHQIDVATAAKSAIEKKYAPEFRNRIDKVIVFNRLEKDTMLMIVDKFFAKVVAHAKENDVNLTITPDAKKWLSDKGFDPDYGARPMSRVINDAIKTPLARKMIMGNLEHGGDCTVDVKDGDIILV